MSKKILQEMDILLMEPIKKEAIIKSIVKAKYQESNELLCVKTQSHIGEYISELYLMSHEEIKKLYKKEVMKKDDKNQNSLLSNKEQKSLLKIFNGLAKADYGYDEEKTRNYTVPTIRKKLESVGINMDDDTIRKFIRMGNEL